MSHGPHTGGKKRRNVVDLGHIGAGNFCDGRDCVNEGREVLIDGARRISLCVECFPVRKGVLANQGIHMDWVVPPPEDTSP